MFVNNIYGGVIMTLFSFILTLIILIFLWVLFRGALVRSVVTLKMASKVVNDELSTKLDERAEKRGLKSQAEILKKDYWKDL